MELDPTAQLRKSLEAIALGSPAFFVAWVAFGIVLNGGLGIASAAYPDYTVLADFASRPTLHYAIAYLVMWLASWRTRSELRQEDETYVRLIARLAKEGELSPAETRQMLREALRVELERRKSSPVSSRPNSSAVSKTPSGPALS